MPQINGRSLEQARRYDLFKLAVAVLLFIAWLFFTDRMPTTPAGSADTVAIAGVAAPAPGNAESWPSRLRIESVDGRIRLQGSVPDEATRNEYLAAARKALGRADRVDDGLGVADAAGRPDWLSHVGPAISAIAGHDGVSAAIDSDRIILQGSVADEAQRTGLADQVTAAFGAPFTVVNQLTIAESAAIAPTVSIASTAVQVAPAPVSVFFEEGVTRTASGDGDKLAPLVRYARDHEASLRISGFHSKTGSAERNAEIARERAFAVRDALVELGIAADRIILDKPREMLGEDEDRRARRVDVGIDG